MDAEAEYYKLKQLIDQDLVIASHEEKLLAVKLVNSSTAVALTIMFEWKKLT
jgi:hypothetical protein